MKWFAIRAFSRSSRGVAKMCCHRARSRFGCFKPVSAASPTLAPVGVEPPPTARREGRSSPHRARPGTSKRSLRRKSLGLGDDSTLWALSRHPFRPTTRTAGARLSPARILHRAEGHEQAPDTYLAMVLRPPLFLQRIFFDPYTFHYRPAFKQAFFECRPQILLCRVTKMSP